MAPPTPPCSPPLHPAVSGDMREQECLRCQHDRQMLVHEDERSKASLRRARSASGLTLLREATDREFVVHKVRLIF